MVIVSPVKVLGGILADFSKRFQTFVDRIRGYAERIETLAQRGYTSVLLDSKKTLDQTAIGTAFHPPLAFELSSDATKPYEIFG